MYVDVEFKLTIGIRLVQIVKFKSHMQIKHWLPLKATYT